MLHHEAKRLTLLILGVAFDASPLRRIRTVRAQMAIPTGRGPIHAMLSGSRCLFALAQQNQGLTGRAMIGVSLRVVVKGAFVKQSCFPGLCRPLSFRAQQADIARERRFDHLIVEVSCIEQHFFGLRTRHSCALIQHRCDDLCFTRRVQREGRDDPLFVGQNRRFVRCRKPPSALQALYHGLRLAAADAQGFTALAMAVASGLTRLEDLLALPAALLLLLHGLIIGCPLNRLDSGFCARLDGLFPEQIVVRASRFNDGAVTGQTRAVRTTGFQYRARERFKKILSQRVFVQYDEAADIGMIRRNAACHPHTPQIESRQPLQLTQ
jgi:hypothetical protein